MDGRAFENLTIFLQQSEQHLEELMALGGPVMWPLLAVSLLLWTLVLGRYWFLIHTFPALVERSLPDLRSPRHGHRDF